MEDTNDSQTVNNQTVSNGESGNTPSISDAMGSMNQSEPAAKPVNGENANGTDEPQNDSGKSLPAWTSQLPDTIKGNEDVMKQLQKFEKIGDLANSYAELEKKLGKSVVTPGKDATAEEVSAFYERIGKPKTAEGYDNIEGENADDFKKIAFEANLTKAQAEAIFKGMGAYGAQILENQKASADRQMRETDEMLHKEYGNKYSEKISLLQRGVQAYGGKELGKLLNDAGIFYHPSIVKLFITLGEQSAESGMTTKGSGGSTSKYMSTSEGGAFTFKGLN